MFACVTRVWFVRYTGRWVWQVMQPQRKIPVHYVSDTFVPVILDEYDCVGRFWGGRALEGQRSCRAQRTRRRTDCLGKRIEEIPWKGGGLPPYLIDARINQERHNLPDKGSRGTLTRPSGQQLQRVQPLAVKHRQDSTN